MLQRSAGHLEQDAVLVADTSKIGNQFALHLAVRVRVDLVDQRDQEIDQ